MDYSQWVERLRRFIFALQQRRIYLKHEDQSFLLARTFDEFLEQCEKLGYVGTNDLKNYRNRQTGFLDVTTAKAVALRERLGLGSYS
jgi:hypothetical protein